MPPLGKPWPRQACVWLLPEYVATQCFSFGFSFARTPRRWENPRLAGAQEVMSVPTKSIIESRRDQIFPVLETADIERMRRFGRLRSFRAGEVLARAGNI